MRRLANYLSDFTLNVTAGQRDIGAGVEFLRSEGVSLRWKRLRIGTQPGTQMPATLTSPSIFYRSKKLPTLTLRSNSCAWQESALMIKPAAFPGRASSRFATGTMTVNSPSAHRHKPLRIPRPFDLDV
jgi:hypothetical protein